MFLDINILIAAIYSRNASICDIVSHSNILFGYGGITLEAEDHIRQFGPFLKNSMKCQNNFLITKFFYY